MATDDDKSIDCGLGAALSASVNACSDSFKVIIRVRPPIPRELEGSHPYEHTVFVDAPRKNVTISEDLGAIAKIFDRDGQSKASIGGLLATHRFAFDHVFDVHSKQGEIYDKCIKDLILSVLEGYNGTVIAYGQTGTGKTYTMEGSADGKKAGVIPRAIEDIFAYIERDPDPSSQYLVRASYMQIYNESISDLLKEERDCLSIREDARKGVYVHRLSEWIVRSPAQVYELMFRGSQLRAIGTTNMNEISSRSHAILKLIVEKSIMNSNACLDAAEQCSRPSSPTGADGQCSEISRTVKVGKLNLVDLAGSERVHVTGATGRRLEESKKINQSLSALGNVIAAMTSSASRSHIPFRDSKLTRILEDTLEAFAESVSTLKFANRAKKIKNEAVVNEDLDQRALLRKYERELKLLRLELKQRNADLVDKRRLLEVEEQKRRAERDKLAAITALEERSRDFMREKKLKEKLEKKINIMQSQLILGGRKIENTPVFRTMVAREHKKIRNEYETRLKQLEKERENVDADKAHVERYKKLLLKQRDIMIALTARLNERDEEIVRLQEELDVMEQREKKLEDVLDHKSNQLLRLKKAAALEAVQHTPTIFNRLQQVLEELEDDTLTENLPLEMSTAVQLQEEITDLNMATEFVNYSDHTNQLE